MTALALINWIAGFIVLAEALNKLERTVLFARGRSTREFIVNALKCAGWVLLALGSGGVVIAPVLGLSNVPAYESIFNVGFALLVLRTRVRETMET